MTRLPIAYFGEPVLRKKGERVEKITPEIRKLIADMIETMDIEEGIGLAAPQVFRSLLIFVTRVPTLDPQGKWIEGKVRIFINPKIISRSEEEIVRSEACISIPNAYGDVSRPAKIVLEATDLEGNRFVEEFSGLEARCLMHENDHINGTLYIDRMNAKDRKEIEVQLREIKKKYSQKK